MWNEEQCCEFLKNYCDQYPECDLRKDSAILAKERLNPSCFNHLIELYDRHPDAFKNWFPGFASCNLIRLYEGMQRYVRKNGKMVQINKHRQAIKNHRLETRNKKEWIDSVKKFVLYYHDRGDKNPMRCAVAISPTLAVANFYGSYLQLNSSKYYCHKTNKDLRATDLYFLYDKTRKPVKTEVVEINSYSDFIILEVVDGQKFFHGDIKDHILEVPCVGQELLAVGLQIESTNDASITEGVVLNDGPDYGYQMFASFVNCPADFGGGGLFSRSNKFLGFLSNSCSPKSQKNYLTRTPFAPASRIKLDWESHMVDSGQIPSYKGARLREE